MEREEKSLSDFVILSIGLSGKIEDLVTKRKTSSSWRFFLFCRDDWIRTSGLLHPMQTRYRAALRPEFPLKGMQIYNKNSLLENEFNTNPYLRIIPYR